jgi:hypothetical protein
MSEQDGKTPLQASGAGHPKGDDGVGTDTTHGRTGSWKTAAPKASMAARARRRTTEPASSATRRSKARRT